MKLKNYSAQKRFVIWVETKIAAANLSEAVSKVEELKPSDFAEFPPNSLNDWEPLPGTSVGEDW